MGKIASDSGWNIEKEYVQVHVHCPQLLPDKTTSSDQTVIIVTVCVVVIIVLLILCGLFWYCKKSKHGTFEQTSTKGNIDQDENDNIEINKTTDGDTRTLLENDDTAGMDTNKTIDNERVNTVDTIE
eukprot:TRINITY_DN5076_c0_g1_i1.p1 TRINITY_DN5076_c0_g1~~TRINITY_DN5076_c0_g1_i1.p1  ORF type:complete len:127 (+),score=18.64 TRINITY_DN5076_c0_g1_i1:74-454(+)